MSASIVDDESRVLDLISAYAAQKNGQRGIETYLWIVAMLRDAPVTSATLPSIEICMPTT